MRERRRSFAARIAAGLTASAAVFAFPGNAQVPAEKAQGHVAKPAASDPASVHAAQSDYWVYVAAESADQIYQVVFDGARARVAAVIDVGYQPTEIEGPHGLTVGPGGKHWYLSMAHGKPFGIVYKYSTKRRATMIQRDCRGSF